MGYAAAVYEDRIYYVSNELGTPGIYSMRFDGTDTRIETENPSITNLQISDGILYFNGLFLIKKSQGSIQTSSINNYAIYWGGLGERILRAEYSHPYMNVNASFVSSDGYTAVRYGSFMEELYLYNAEFSNSFDNTSKKVAEISFKYTENNLPIDCEENITKDIVKSVNLFGDLYIIAQHIPNPIGTDYITYNEAPYVLNPKTGELVLSFYYNQAEALKAFYMDENNIYCSYKEMVVVVDRTSYQVTETFIPEGLSDKYHITNILKCRDSFYIIADYWENQDEKWPPLLGEKLYKMNPTSFDTSVILDLGKEQRIIGIDQKYFIILDNGMIKKAALDNGKIGESIKLCDAPEEIYSKNHTIDYAGDWMFVYKVYPEHGGFTYGGGSPGQQLLMKVNLESGEIIRNDIKLDFTALDKYREK